MSEAHADAYLACRAATSPVLYASAPQHLARLRPILSSLLEMRLSLRDQATVAAVCQRVNDVDVSA